MGSDARAAATTGIEQAGCREAIEAGLVLRSQIVLLHDVVPVEAEPAEILPEGLAEARATALRIEVLEAQEEPRAARAGVEPAEQRREERPRMRRSCGRGREA